MITALAIMATTATLMASVVCVWDNNAGGYICSGEGTPVEVYGGSGQLLPPVVTNVVGVCTNCTDIAPDELKAKLDEAMMMARFANENVDSARSMLGETEDMLDERIYQLEQYQTFPYPGNTDAVAITNYVESSGTEQAEIVREIHTGGHQNAQFVLRQRYYWYGLETTYALAQKEIESLDRARGQVETSIGHLETAESQLYDVDTMLQSLYDDCRDCQYKTNGLSNGGTGGMGERWCTEEQGDALISLLEELRDYGQSMQRYAQATTNYLALGVQTIKEQYLTAMKGIPENADWRSIYFDQTPTAWGYDPTNILHRLELLVYGLASSSSNGLTAAQAAEIKDLDEQAAEITEEQEDNTDTLKRGMDGLMGNFATDASGQQVQSLGQALVAFFQAVGDLDGSEIQAGAEVFPSYPLKLGQNEFYVPNLSVGDDVSQLNKYQAVSKSVFAAIWYIMAAVSAFVYWRWFAGYAVRFTKWASELAKATMES